MKVIISPDGEKAFNSQKFSYAYIREYELGGLMCLRVILKNKVELYWDSSPGTCCYAEKDMIESLSLLVSKLEDISVIVSKDGKQAFNIDEFCSLRMENCKENYSTRLILTLKSVVDIRWVEIPYDDDSEDLIKKELQILCSWLRKR